ncbi:contactin-associated protein-like 2 [Acropora millepora]|uniref:contactin-associated protein-like 2 n=1 Tax=Acropora millepora TaxID=45264 RepID=UPI001CF0F75F|nr:contactin-associated protein-like 2 [Acropora millepora]
MAMMDGVKWRRELQVSQIPHYKNQILLKMSKRQRPLGFALLLLIASFKSSPGYFPHAVGVQDPSIIPDNQMTASSYYSSSYYPHFGRLHDIRGGGWAGKTSSNPSDWLQVNFGRIALVCAVATQGDKYLNEWVIDFSLSFSSDGASWMYSNDSQWNKMVFTRMGNNFYVDRQTLPAPISARYIRFHPISQHIWNTLRVEVYEAYFPHAIGVQDPSIIPDNQMTASSYHSSSHYPHSVDSTILEEVAGRGEHPATLPTGCRWTSEGSL